MHCRTPRVFHVGTQERQTAAGHEAEQGFGRWRAPSMRVWLSSVVPGGHCTVTLSCSPPLTLSKKKSHSIRCIKVASHWGEAVLPLSSCRHEEVRVGCRGRVCGRRTSRKCSDGRSVAAAPEGGPWAHIPPGCQLSS